MVKLPGDGHRPLADVASVGGGAEEPERAVVGPQPGEQQDRAAVAFVVAVAQAGRAVGTGDGLALPVDERPADGVVAVAGGGGEAAAALVEREREQLGVGGLGFVDAALPGGDLGRRRRARRRRGSRCAVAGVDLQRARRDGCASGAWRWSMRSSSTPNSSSSSRAPAGGPTAGRPPPAGVVSRVIAWSATAATSMWSRRRSRSGSDVGDRWRSRLREQSPVGGDAFGVVDVEQATDGSPQRPSRRDRRARIGAPAASRRSDQLLRAVVDVVEVEPGLVRGTRRVRCPGRSRRSERSSSTLAGQRVGIASRRLRSTISAAFSSSCMWQPAGRNGNCVLHGAFDVAAGTAEQGAVAAVEAELLAVGADEVEHGAERLARRLAQASPELLEEQGRALGRAQHQDGVDVRNVDALVEQVDGEHHPDPTGGQVPQRGLALGVEGCRPRRRRRRCRGG